MISYFSSSLTESIGGQIHMDASQRRCVTGADDGSDAGEWTRNPRLRGVLKGLWGNQSRHGRFEISWQSELGDGGQSVVLDISFKGLRARGFRCGLVIRVFWTGHGAKCHNADRTLDIRNYSYYLQQTSSLQNTRSYVCLVSRCVRGFVREEVF